MRLTPEGVRVARQLAMLGEDRQDVLIAAHPASGASPPQDQRAPRDPIP